MSAVCQLVGKGSAMARSPNIDRLAGAVAFREFPDPVGGGILLR
jgi:hypothetical protein